MALSKFAPGVMLLAMCLWQAVAVRSLVDERQGNVQATGRTPPSWPESYEVEYTVSLPYVKMVQPGGLKYPVHVWWDGPGRRYRFDAYGGLDSTGWDLGKGISWNLYPRVLEMACGVVDDEDVEEPIVPLPDISDWEYAGTAQVRNTAAFVWQYAVRHGEKTAQYTFYTAQNGWPLKFYMMGVDLTSGSHFDEYVVDFTRFKPGPLPASAFKLPAVCENAAGAARSAEQLEQQRRRQAGAAARMGPLLPASLLGPSPGALAPLRDQVASAFEANARLVAEHNRISALAASGYDDDEAKGQPSYTLALNHFAHMTRQQWRAVYLGRNKKTKRGASSGGATGGSPRYYQRVLRDNELPESVDWRGTGADGPVKDQVYCGSCWAFSTTGAMQGAWFKATGQSLSFSEQQLVDCSWEYGNNGCAGGDVDPAVQYVVEAGGITLEADYPYRDQNHFCRVPVVSPTTSHAAAAAASTTSSIHPSSSSPYTSATAATPGLNTTSRPRPRGPPAPLAARFSGSLKIRSRDEKALMEAVALHGPVAVAMNSGLSTFAFYSDGVYSDPECKQGQEDLDHAVLLVGYGTTPVGVDYWIIKNCWSKYWGMDGYAHVARKGNDCGVSTDALLVLVDPEAVGRAVGRAAAEEAAAARSAAV